MPPLQFQLIVTLTDDGESKNVQVQGPIKDKVLCYGMLEMAKDAIRDYRPPPSLRVAGPEEVDILRRNGGLKPPGG